MNLDFISIIILNSIFFIYKFVGNFGWAIVILTLIIRFLMLPLITPSIKLSQKMRDIGPQLEKLKKKYQNDKAGLSRAQLELYRQAGINPAAGCLPSIIQIVLLIAFYGALAQIFPLQGKATDIVKINSQLHPFLQVDPSALLNSGFWYLNLAKPDIIRLPGLTFPLPGFFLILAALTQFLSSKMMTPTIAAQATQAQKTPGKEDDMATMMQKQMLYMFPLMTLLVGFSFPSGLVLYWLVFSVFQLGQQYKTSGWGGLEPWIRRMKN